MNKIIILLLIPFTLYAKESIYTTELDLCYNKCFIEYIAPRDVACVNIDMIFQLDEDAVECFSRCDLSQMLRGKN